MMNAVLSVAPGLATRMPLVGLDLAALARIVKEPGEPGFRVTQLHSWVYVHHARRFEEMMTHLTKSRREKL